MWSLSFLLLPRVTEDTILLSRQRDISEGASDTTIFSTGSSIAKATSRNLANELEGLRTRFQEAQAQVDCERVLDPSNEVLNLGGSHLRTDN